MADSSISGLDAVFSALDDWQQQVTEAADQEVQGAGIECEAGAKQRARVDTGRFRAGYQYQNTGVGSCQVSNPVEYGPDLEFGTSKMPAYPSLFPAFVEASANLQDNLKNL